jgi:hypothetical protein
MWYGYLQILNVRIQIWSYHLNVWPFRSVGRSVRRIIFVPLSSLVTDIANMDLESNRENRQKRIQISLYYRI